METGFVVVVIAVSWSLGKPLDLLNNQAWRLIRGVDRSIEVIFLPLAQREVGHSPYSGGGLNRSSSILNN